MEREAAIGKLKNLLTKQYAATAELCVPPDGEPTDRSWACLELTRSFDYAFWRASRAGLRNDEYYFDAKVKTRGFNRALSFLLPEEFAGEGVPDAPSCESSQRWADTILTRCGLLELAQRIVDMERIGLVRFVSGTEKTMQFSLAADAGVREKRDTSSFWWISDGVRQQDRDEYEDLERRSGDVQTLLKKHAHVWQQRYLGYSTVPELDEYFARHARLHARKLFGFDAFSPETRFGGLTFGAFTAAAVALAGWSMKHIAFAEAMLDEHSELDIRNLLTAWSPLEWKVGYLAAQLDTSFREAAELLAVFVGTPETTKRLAAIHDAPIPILLPVAKNRYLFSVAAAQISPYQLLLRQLRATFEADYFRNIAEREERFRDDLRTAASSDRIKFAARGVVLKEGDRDVTDIDAVALDRETGTLGLFQLKWQDPLAGDMRELRNRATNMVLAANRWVQAVCDWIERHGADGIGRQAGLLDGRTKTVGRAVLFVVGKYHAAFSLMDSPDARAAWCTWGQLLQVLQKSQAADDVIGTVNSVLKAEQSTDHRRRDEGDEIDLGELKIEIVRAE